MAADEHMLFVVVHHAVFDGWSIGVFVREIAALYRAEATGERSGLDELPVQFADYALWERDRMQGAAVAELEDYWRKAMEGYPTVEFPTDRPRPARETFDGDLADHSADRELLDALRELSRREYTTLFCTMMASLHALLHKYTGQTDLVVGTASANRSRRETGPLIGYLINMLPVRADLSGDPPFTELLGRVREATNAAYAHQDLPLGKIVETLRVERDPTRNPLFQISLGYADREDIPVPVAGVDVVLTNLVMGIRAAKFDLALLVEARPDELRFECTYKTRLFGKATISRLLRHWEVLLRGVAANPSARLSELAVLTDHELRQELTEWNDTAASRPQLCLQEGFEAQAARTPEAVAAVFGGKRVSYAELNGRANQVAWWLRGLRVGPEVLCGVCLGPGLDRLAVLLGILKAGGGYVPLDPELPPQRLGYLIEDAGPAVVLADTALLASGGPLAGLAGADGLAVPWAELAGLDRENLVGTGVSPRNAAYVIYTSGSTGQPKGVVVEHGQAVNFAYGMIGVFGIGPGDAVLGFASLSFDVSVMDMFLPLLAGGRIVIAAPPERRSPPQLARLMRAAGVTWACLTPSVLGLLAGQEFPALRCAVSGGEELSGDLTAAWQRPGLEVWNTYGPTEAAVVTTYIRLEDADREGARQDREGARQDGAAAWPPPMGRPAAELPGICAG